MSQVVEAFDTPRRNVDYNFYLLQVTAAHFEPTEGDILVDVPKLYLQAGHLAQLDKFLCTHGAFAAVHGK